MQGIDGKEWDPEICDGDISLDQLDISRKQLEPARHSVPPLPDQHPFCVWEQASLLKDTLLAAPGTDAFKGDAQDPAPHFQNEVKSQHFPKKQQGTPEERAYMYKKKNETTKKK